MSSKHGTIQYREEVREEAEARLKGSGAPEHARQEDPLRLVHELEVHAVELEMQNEDLRRTRLELEESRDRYWMLYDRAPFGYLTLEHDGTIVEANAAALELFRAFRGDVVGRQLAAFMDMHDAARFIVTRKAVSTFGVKQICDLRLRRLDGSRVHVRLEMTFDSEIRDARLNTVIVDVSDLRQVEDDLRQSEGRFREIAEREAVGAPASGVAHDLRNVLQAIRSSIEIVKLKGISHEASARALERALMSTERGVSLVDQLTTVAHK